MGEVDGDCEHIFLRVLLKKVTVKKKGCQTGMKYQLIFSQDGSYNIFTCLGNNPLGRGMSVVQEREKEDNWRNYILNRE